MAANLVAALFPLVFANGVVGIEPTFDELAVNVTVTKGQTAELPCFIDILGKFKVAWLDAHSMPLTYEDRRVVDDTRFTVVRPSIREWNLQIRDSEVDDTGQYLCTINTNPIRSKFVTLVVQDPATIVDDSRRREVTVVEGEDVILYCNATGTPEPTVAWYRKSDQLMVQDNLLSLSNVSRHDDDTYQCVADNGVGPRARSRTKLSVEFRPSIVMPNRRIGQTIGRETILECTITAYPQAINYWQKDGRRISNAPGAGGAAYIGSFYSGYGQTSPGASAAMGRQQPGKYRIEAYDEGDHTLTLYLRLQVTDHSDYGEYICVASNARGSDHGVVLLYEFAAPDTKQSLAVQQPSPPTNQSVKTSAAAAVAVVNKRTSTLPRAQHNRLISSNAPVNDRLMSHGRSGSSVQLTVSNWPIPSFLTLLSMLSLIN